ncbi:MAG: ABC transporter permease subunit [Ilumatobacter sp.]|nr:ABC transporter permease subunit [Ilumatobacter sp.]
MTDTAVPAASVHHTRPPLWRNTNVLKWGVQIAVLAAVIASFWFLIEQAGTNLSDKGFDVSYDWLDGPANIQVAEGIQTAATDEQPFNMGRALWVGMTNTLRISAIGILASTILGVILGIARLSHNWLASKIASIFVETLRNIPVLVQILLWAVIVASLPELTGDPGEKGWFYASKKGISFPRLFYADGFYQFVSLLLILCVGVWFVRRYLKGVQAREGGEQHIGAITFALFAIAVVIAWFANGIMTWPRGIFHGIRDGWAEIPQGAMQLVLSALAVAAAVLWIKRFLDSRRTPAGLARLTDDDYFRMIFAALGAVVIVFVVFVLWPGLSSWMINSGSDFWGWLGDKFGGGRDTRPLDGMRPTLSEGGRFVNYAPTGWTLTPAFAALFLGLTFYTASFIAEIVRGGILAVPKGQTEAAAALGLSRAQSLRKVVLPQAFRVIMPPLGNQYLNITKNSSLGIAVAFADVVQVGQTIYNKNNQVLAVFSIFMIFFLICSLTISSVVNYINNKLAIVER